MSAHRPTHPRMAHRVPPGTAAIALTLVLSLMALVRVALFWHQEPMLAYANSYDQVRALSALGLAPEGLEDERFQSTPQTPFRWFQSGLTRLYNYPSSDIVLSDLYYRLASLLDPSPRVDIKNKSLFLLLMWGAGLLWCLLRLMKLRPWWAVAFSAWLLLVADPINLLFLNTLYAEFSALAAVTLLVGLGWVALAQNGLGRKPLWVGLALLLLLATNRQQYTFLPLLAVPMAWICFASLRSGTGVVVGVLVMVVPLTLYAMGDRFDELQGNSKANRVDTVMGALLPAASHPDTMLMNLGLPAACSAFIGKSWYTVSPDALPKQCPELLTLPLSRYLKALAHDPLALWRMTRQALPLLQNSINPFLGLIEGRAAAQRTDLPGLNAWTLEAIFNRVPARLWVAGSLLLLLAPPILGLFAWRAGHKGWLAATLALSGLWAYCVLTSLLGDGYVDFSRHAILTFPLGLLCLIFVMAAPPLIKTWRSGRHPIESS